MLLADSKLPIWHSCGHGSPHSGVFLIKRMFQARRGLRSASPPGARRIKLTGCRGGKPTPWDTKANAGTRTINLAPGTVALLRERKKPALTEWSFPHPLKPEQPIRPSAADERRKDLLKQAELPDIRFHDLRHPYVKPTTTNFYLFFKCEMAISLRAFLCFALLLGMRKALNLCLSSGKTHANTWLPILQ